MEVDSIVHSVLTGSTVPSPPLAVQTPAEVFEEIFLVFLALGTLVGIVVISYTLYNAYKYRDTEKRRVESKADEMTLGELPTGGTGGKKLLLSFTISAIIVVSLLLWTYGFLAYIEAGPDLADGETAATIGGSTAAGDITAASAAAQGVDRDADLVVGVVGYQFGWEFQYPNGHTENNELRVPEGAYVQLEVTSRDVWHAFGASELRIKADSIPGQTATTWFLADEQGTYLVECFELCGVGHSYMEGEIVVEDPDEWQAWYDGLEEADDEGGEP